MTITDHDTPQLCRGLAHEFSNILTFVLPAIDEVMDLQRGLVPLLGNGPLAGQLLDFTPADLERIGQQLRLGGGRLSRIFRDLKLASCSLPPDRLAPLRLGPLLHEAIQPFPTIAWDAPAGQAQVLGEPILLTEALSRMMRAATGWAQTVTPAPEVRLLVDRLSGRVRIRVLLAGDPARLPGPDSLLSMLCPNESGALRAERGPLGILVGIHLLRVHGGDLTAARQADGVALCGELAAQE